MIFSENTIEYSVNTIRSIMINALINRLGMRMDTTGTGLVQYIYKIMKIAVFFGGMALAPNTAGQEFIFGQDLSYVNQMEDCGAVFQEDGVPKDVYRIFADHETNLVRVRLWVDPSWWQDPLDQPDGVKPHYNDYEDVKETIQRAKDEGMKVMLGLHYSDFWADPGRQLIPRSWLDVAYDLEALKDSVYDYTARVLRGLEGEGLMPDFVKIGNETNGGILKHIPEENGYDPASTVSNSWSRHAQLFNAGIKAVRDVGATASINPEVVLHFSNQLSGQVWNFNNIISNGVTDFDVIGISYYYAWHGGSIGELESTIRNLVQTFPAYQVMVVETGYLWTTKNFDSMGNIINEPDPRYLPVIPEKQLEYMVDYTRAVMRAGGKGVIFWEPAWVSTPCRTPWGIGSSHDHVVFFDPYNTNFMENGGGIWCHPEYYEDLDAKKVTFKVNASEILVPEGVFIAGSWLPDTNAIVPMADEGNGLFSYFTYLPEGSEGSYFFLSGESWDSIEPVPVSCRSQDNDGRDYQIGSTNELYSFHWGICNPASAPQELNERCLIFPNPARDRIRVNLSPGMQNSTIDLYEATGKKIKVPITSFSGSEFSLDLNGLEEGLYILKIQEGDRLITRKLIIRPL